MTALVAIDAINASRIVAVNRLSDCNIGSVSAAFDLNKHYEIGYFATRYTKAKRILHVDGSVLWLAGGYETSS